MSASTHERENDQSMMGIDHGKRRPRKLLAAAVIAVGLLVAAAPASAEYDLTFDSAFRNADSTPATQDGSHPYEAVTELVATNEERLSAHNGLLLAPHADFLFDRGFISFADGQLLVSPVADEKTMVKLGVDPDRPPIVGKFSREQERFLEFHRTEIFRSASVR